MRLIFVDNHNNPSWPVIDKDVFAIEYLKPPRPMRFTDANNFGVQNTKHDTEYLIFLNQDTVSTSGWIDTCIECFENDYKLGVLSLGLHTYDLADWEPNLASCSRESGVDLDERSTNCCLSSRRDALRSREHSFKRKLRTRSVGSVFRMAHQSSIKSGPQHRRVVLAIR